jgi:hypothetical protein
MGIMDIVLAPVAALTLPVSEKAHVGETRDINKTMGNSITNI